MTRTLIVAVAAAGSAASGLAAHTRLTAAPASCPNVAEAAAQGGCLLDPWPGVPSAYSTAVAKAAFAREYGTIWGYVAPIYQKAVSESRWQACQKQNPVAPPGVKIKSVKVADSKSVPVVLPLLGQVTVRTVTVQIVFTRVGSGEQIALQYAYWIKNPQGKWFAVWLPAVYTKYKNGNCDAGGPARGLY